MSCLPPSTTLITGPVSGYSNGCGFEDASARQPAPPQAQAPAPAPAPAPTVVPPVVLVYPTVQERNPPWRRQSAGPPAATIDAQAQTAQTHMRPVATRVLDRVPVPVLAQCTWTYVTPHATPSAHPPSALPPSAPLPLARRRRSTQATLAGPSAASERGSRRGSEMTNLRPLRAERIHKRQGVQ